METMVKLVRDKNETKLPWLSSTTILEECGFDRAFPQHGKIAK